MTHPRFIQIHTLHSYPAALLNRDDTGLAKRMQYGGHSRTRISSQCLKRHWRTAQGKYAWSDMEGFVPAYRSRSLVTKLIIDPILAEHNPDEKSAKTLDEGFQIGVYGKNASDPAKRQPLLLGQPETDYLKKHATRLLQEHPSDAKKLKTAIADFFKEEKKNIGALKENTTLPGGLASALFGRMVTSDPEANIDAAIHVAHAFTTHAEESESDYFSVVDDLNDDSDDTGAAHIGDTELTAGLFYGYVVVDIPALISNTTGTSAEQWLNETTDRSLAAEITRRLIHLISTITPGAKLGSTAPYSWAPMTMVEIGDDQPRSLAEAFRQPTEPQLIQSLNSLSQTLTKFDACYGDSSIRRHCCIDDNFEPPSSEHLSLAKLSSWVSDCIKSGACND